MIVVGRGNGGTRLIANSLRRSGVYMGEPLNFADDLIPPDEMYEACRIAGSRVEYLGDLRWDFSKLHTGRIDPLFTRLIKSYLASVMRSKSPWRGWKIPETTLCLPWIVRMFPEARYVYWSRDPRDALLGFHMTDELALFGIPRPYAEDVLSVRSISWLYQAQIMADTPRPGRVIDCAFEDFVLHHERELARLEEFFGFPLAPVDVDPSHVGYWREHPGEWQREPVRPEFPTILLNMMGRYGYCSDAACVSPGEDVQLRQDADVSHAGVGSDLLS